MPIVRPKPFPAPQNGQQLRLLVAVDSSPDDDEAIKLLREQFNNALRVARVQPARHEILPQLWEADVCYPGLASIRRFVDVFGHR